MAKAKPQRKPPATPAAKKSIPLIDPTAAIETAAALVGRGVSTPPTPTGPRKESASFKQLKEGLNQPAAGAISSALDKSSGPIGKKSAVPFSHGSRQVGHNQTFGADVSRSGVPRRTAG
jgi:hypothetical protein